MLKRKTIGEHRRDDFRGRCLASRAIPAQVCARLAISRGDLKPLRTTDRAFCPNARDR